MWKASDSKSETSSDRQFPFPDTSWYGCWGAGGVGRESQLSIVEECVPRVVPLKKCQNNGKNPHLGLILALRKS